LYAYIGLSNNSLSGYFTYVLTFTSDVVVPREVEPAVLQWVMAVHMHGENPWEAALKLLAVDWILGHSPVLLIYRDESTKRTHRREIVYSWPHSMPWGMDFLTKCVFCDEPFPLNVQMKWVAETVDGIVEHHKQIRFKCLSCAKKTPWVVRPDWLNPVPHRPCAYWHEYECPNPHMDELVAQFKGATSEHEDTDEMIIC
jgi:hypothetical protein